MDEKEDTDQQVETFAGSALLGLAVKDSCDGRRKLFEYERLLLENSFAVGQNDSHFRATYIDAFKLALKTKNHDVVEILLAKDTAHAIFKDECKILQVAMSAEGGRWTQDSQLRANIEMLISYGAPINSLDEEGKTPLY